MIVFSTPFGLNPALLNVHASGSSMNTVLNSVTRSFSYPLLKFGGQDASNLTQTIQWYTNGTTELSDDKGYRYTLTVPASADQFVLLQNSTTVDQRVIGPDLQYDIYWKPVTNTSGYVDKYKFSIVGTSVNGSQINLLVKSDQNIVTFGTKLLATNSTFLNNNTTLTTASSTNATLGRPTNSTYSKATAFSGFQGLGIDWSDAVNSGYPTSFDNQSSTLNIKVGKSFNIDPTTVDQVNVNIAPASCCTADGQTRIFAVGGTTFAFYYDGSNIVYKTSTNNGTTWSSTATSSRTGALDGITTEWTLVTETSGGTTYVVLCYYTPTSKGTSTNFDVLKGTISGTSITWDRKPTVLFTASNYDSTNQAYGGAAASTDTNGNIFVVFRWLSPSPGNYQYQIFKADSSFNWSTSLSTTTVSGLIFPVTLTKLSGGKMLFATDGGAQIVSGELSYRVYDGVSSWSSTSATSGAGITGTCGGHYLAQISAYSDSSQSAYVAYTTGMCSGALKVARWYNNGTFEGIETADSTLSHTLPSISITPDNIVNIFTLSGSQVYETRKIGSSWTTPSLPFGTAFSSPNDLTAGVSLPAALWIENSATPYSVKFASTNIYWESSGYKVTTSSLDQIEPSIVVQTNNSSRVVSVNTDYSSGGNCNIFKSTDGGVTWSFITNMVKVNSTDNMFDTVATSSQNGNFYVVCEEEGSAKNYIRIGQSSDGSNWIFSSNVTATHPIDKPWIVADHSTNATTQNNVYICWTDNNTSILVQRVVPYSGTTFTVDSHTGNTYYVQGCNMAIGPNGQLYVAYERYSFNGIPTNGTIELRRNFNGDSGPWDNNTYFVGKWQGFPNGKCSGNNECIDSGAGKIRVNHYPTIAVDSVGTVHVAFANYTGNSTLGDIMYSNSNSCKHNDSCTFSNPIKINLDIGANDQWDPALTVSSLTSTVHVTAYDRRNDATNTYYQVYDYQCNYGTSPNDCTNQSQWYNQLVSSSSSFYTVVNSNVGNTDLIDDYHSITTSTARDAYSNWTANSTDTSNEDIYADRTRS